MTLDPERLQEAIAAIFGALLYGLYHLATLALAGHPATVADYAKAALNLLGALVAGVVTAWFCGPALTHAIPIAALRDGSAVGFVIGGLAWELIPVAIQAARGRLGKLGGGA